MAKSDLRLDWATSKAARYACEHWHYSGSVPAGKCVYVGAWESERFVGVVIFARGASNALGSPYGLKPTECVELVRVAMRDHVSAVSRIVAVALKFLRKNAPGVRLVVSFADPEHGHHGGIYQAGNWVYSGTTAGERVFVVGGKRYHRRAFTGRQFGTGGRSVVPEGATMAQSSGKHRYLMPLDDEMRAVVEKLRKPYPRPKQAMAGTTSTAAGQHRPGRSDGEGGEVLR